MKPELQPLVVSATEAAKMLGISRTKLYQLSHCKDFPVSFKCGNRTLFSVAALKEWVDYQIKEQNKK